MEYLVNQFSVLTDEQKVKVLAKISHYVTISARGISLEGNCQQRSERLAAVNEFQHRALSQILSYLDQRKERYSDESIVKILMRIAECAGLLQDFTKAFEKAIRDQTPGPSKFRT